MERPIDSVDIVSDGIVVRFRDGLLAYFPHSFLRDHIRSGSNQVFVDCSASGDAALPPSHRASPLVN